MILSNPAVQPRSYLILTAAMMTSLILLINTSFKIIVFQGMMFTASSVICPLVACLYLVVLRECTFKQQRQVLNQSLLALYLFSIGIYLLVNLPSADYVRDNLAYQIVFEDIPKKFFAATLAFGLSFYLPHLLCCSRQSEVITSPRKRVLLVLFGGLGFFTIDFLLLFSEPHVQNFNPIYIDSLMIAAGIMFSVSILYLACLLNKWAKIRARRSSIPDFLSAPLYHYLVGFSVIIILICLACEYRLISFSHGWTLAACSILVPPGLIAASLIGELYGYKANLYLMVVLMLSQLMFNLLLMVTMMPPSPNFFDINPFYLFIMPRRIPVLILALFVLYACNALVLEYLKNSRYGSVYRGLRIFMANLSALSLLFLVNYQLLFSGIYPHEQALELAVTSWVYQVAFILVSLPLVLRLYSLLGSYVSNNEVVTPDYDNVHRA
ncbi:VUT family protein [Legionella spiritensis]|uniref:VUT family protein n=1 Tax=Legionella spiritensis TaxID=452 RepID=A0A0W0YZF5_LEGSP|nr:VUT family protein [Legionella spiritensis]KTD62272.1 hypothetical protein Lspi_2122 [Legionella spiritensis]SNV28586.1 Uncharacterized ACR, YhhQ family COG1738 [Legionella spiritensis]